MTEDLETRREWALRDCEHVDRIDAAGLTVAQALVAGQAVEAAFAPGNGCRYVFLFVPIAQTVKVREGTSGESEAVSKGGVWLANCLGYSGGNVIYPLSLIGRAGGVPAASYIGEKWYPHQPETSDVFILERLLQVVADVSSALLPRAVAPA